MTSACLCQSEPHRTLDDASQMTFENILSIIQREYPEISSSSDSETESFTSADLFNPAKAVAMDEDICGTKLKPNKLGSTADIPNDVTRGCAADLMSRVDCSAGVSAFWSPFHGGELFSVPCEREVSLGNMGSSDPFIGECFYNTAEPESVDIFSCEPQRTTQTESDLQTPLSSDLHDDSEHVLFHSIEARQPSPSPRKRQAVESSLLIFQAVQHDHDYCVSNVSAARNMNRKHKLSFQSNQPSWSPPAKRRRIVKAKHDDKPLRQLPEWQREVLRQREQQRRQQSRENYEEIRRLIPPHRLPKNPSNREILEASVKYIAELKADSKKMEQKAARLQKVKANAKERLDRLLSASVDDVRTPCDWQPHPLVQAQVA